MHIYMYVHVCTYTAYITSTAFCSIIFASFARQMHRQHLDWGSISVPFERVWGVIRCQKGTKGGHGPCMVISPKMEVEGLTKAI